jgi:hypothetical protein
MEKRAPTLLRIVRLVNPGVVIHNNLRPTGTTTTITKTNKAEPKTFFRLLVTTMMQLTRKRKTLQQDGISIEAGLFVDRSVLVEEIFQTAEEGAACCSFVTAGHWKIESA